MAQIQVKFDNTLKQSDIIIPLTNSSPDEAGENYHKNQTDIQQTSVYGIQSPLIMVNNVVIDFTDVLSFSLVCKYKHPSVEMVIKDRYNLISSLDTPSIDNELRVQILPQFDGKYKKINLTFYITNIRIVNNIITLKGEYKLTDLTSTQIKSFGEISTYKLFETISSETGLGFASNMEDNEDDKRYVYCDYKSYSDILNREIAYSGHDLQICDWWIDWWNNIVLVDIYERYNTIDPEDKMKLWVSHTNHEVGEGIAVEPEEVAAILNNHPLSNANELYVKSYHITNKPGFQMHNGTDHIYSAYKFNKGEYEDTLVQDGDSKSDIFNSYEYLGETYGEYDYLLSRKKRESFIQKINSNENIEVVLRTPLLGIMRGNKVNFVWYINDSFVSTQRENFTNNDLISDKDTNVPLDDSSVESKSNDGEYIIDKSISGQYLITATEIRFMNMKWEYIVSLSRPTSQKPVIINKE